MSSSVIVIAINLERFPWEKPVLRDNVLSIFSQPKQPLLFYVNTKSCLCVANFPQALFRPQHLNADTLDVLGATMLNIWNAKMFWKKTLPSLYKSRTNTYFKFYQGARWLPLAVIKRFIWLSSRCRQKQVYSTIVQLYSKDRKVFQCHRHGKKDDESFLLWQ